MSKAKYLEDAARLIDERIVALEAEPNQSSADRAAIIEARHLARLIRLLKLGPYRQGAYATARSRWMRGDEMPEGVKP